MATQQGHDSTVTVLASLGADVNTPGEGGVTPVCVAATEGRDSTVRVLASLGADVNADE
jgi:ankyrin repeat protein